MRLLDRLSPRLRDYVREEYRRIWTRRESRTLVFALVVVEVIRVAATMAAVGRQPRFANSPVEILNALGFMSPAIFIGRSGGGIVPAWQWLIWSIQELFGLFYLLVPYYAGRSIASVRKYRDVEELKERGLSEREILLGCGLAHLAPFLAALFASMAVGAVQMTVGTILVLTGNSPVSRVAPQTLSILPLQLLSLLLIVPLSNLARMGIFVCASALTRRVWSGVTVCYGLALLLFPALSIALHALGRELVKPGDFTTSYLAHSFAPTVVTVLLECGLLVPFYLAAQRALAGQPLIHPPKLEGRSLWLAEEDQPAGVVREP